MTETSRERNTVEQLLQWLRDTRVAPSAAIVVQVYGKAVKYHRWQLDFVGGEVVICVDLTSREDG